MLDVHPKAALEYWFFKVNAGPAALLVDWIARRDRHEQALRASVHSPAGREVLFGSYAAMDSGDQVLTMHAACDIIWMGMLLSESVPSPRGPLPNAQRH